MKTIRAAVILLAGSTSAFVSRTTPSTQTTRLHLSKFNDNLTRTNFFTLTSAALSSALLLPSPSSALVKGNAPPPKKEASERKCRNVEECQEMAEKQEMARQQAAIQEAEASGIKPVVVSGTRYLELESGTGAKVKEGDAVEVFYKVLKLGKRSYDGLSGEGTVVFSRGYGLEDDEKAVGDHSFKFTVGDNSVIQALNDSISGMQVGSLRRISVLPQKGWNKNTKQCDGGPGGSGTGGDLKTDYVVVPTATMVEQEACFDKAKLPFPQTYAQERRMAQRFDQSLIMEVRLVNIL